MTIRKGNLYLFYIERNECMSNRNLTYGIGLGVAGAVAGMQLYQRMTPKSQRQIQKSVRNAADQLNDLVQEIGDRLNNISMMD